MENSLSEPQIASTASSFGDGKPEINRKRPGSIIIAFQSMVHSSQCICKIRIGIFCRW